ncbi:hypothetical protein DAI22_03g421500 [Oryza sativa Japonica Group]|uniref:Uncharacterized protein n=1 Tax=Oryza rufipogon TaxID=4529 RepID=A0A0E0P450_ORYRU|nr:hypothetical protein DAI22_03g421500 [Oryza sativa Japonica Group]
MEPLLASSSLSPQSLFSSLSRCPPHPPPLATPPQSTPPPLATLAVALTLGWRAAVPRRKVVVAPSRCAGYLHRTVGHGDKGRCHRRQGGRGAP